MGWDTYLTLDEWTLQSWRKHAPAEARFLFKAGDLLIGKPQNTVSRRSRRRPAEDDEQPVPVEYVTTVGKAIANLDAMGFTWQACIQAEEEMRVGTGFGEGMLMAKLLGEHTKKQQKGTSSAKPFSKPLTKKESRAIELRLQEFERESGEEDLRPLSKFFWDDLRDDKRDLMMPHCWARFLDAYLAVETSERGMLYQRMSPNAVRGFEALAWLKIASPILCWPMTMRIALAGAPKAGRLVLDLTGDAAQHVATSYAKSPQEYAEQFYRHSCDGVSANAQLLGRFLSILAPTPSSPARGFWRGRAESAFSTLSKRATTTKEKGDRLEDLVCALIQMCEPDLEIAERNLRRADEELDVIVSNHIKDPFWTSLHSPLLFIECKNWSSSVGSAELRVFVEKMRERRSLCSVGFLIAPKGFAASLKGLLRPRQAEGLTIFLLTMDDLRELVEGKLAFSEWVPKVGIKKLLKMS